MTENKEKAPDMVTAFDEEDEFEEFEDSDWETPDEATKAADKTKQFVPDWEDEAGWDDEDVDDAFTTKLKAELVKSGKLAA
mmetsp:Transcript_5512/g.13158  ORF Transcript_5512/g.13158 Transcript_5512/m.13158 type:complete len:81 (-) Transcript_5512:122-364(-)